MVNFHLIYKIIGSLLLLLGSLLTLCTGISFYYMEDDIMAFLLSTLITYKLVASSLNSWGVMPTTTSVVVTLICWSP